jgi:hypothetical protein
MRPGFVASNFERARHVGGNAITAPSEGVAPEFGEVMAKLRTTG